MKSKIQNLKSKVAILGGGESGVGAAILAKQLGYEVFLSDQGALKEKHKQDLENEEVEYEENQHTAERIEAADIIIKSPGIPEKAALIQNLKSKGKEVVGEIEFAFRHRPKGSKIVAITGSNGKTTTTLLTAHLMKEAGLNVRMGGNVGHSFARLVAEDLSTKAMPLYVLELSSFQLDDTAWFRANLSILLNITADHLDRYEYDLWKYAASKFRISRNQKTTDYLLLNGNDPITQEYMKKNKPNGKARIQYVKKGFSEHGQMNIARKVFDMTTTKLQGLHNHYNAACAAWATLKSGGDAEAVQRGLETFKTPEHRMEVISEKDGILWVNDSKATNVDSVFYALQAQTRPTVWIVGGQDKGNDYGQLMDLVEQKVKAIVCLGADNSLIVKAFRHLEKPMIEAKSAEEAVKKALHVATKGDVVLLSPACASFDLFENYIQRGEHFRQAVNEL